MFVPKKFKFKKAFKGRVGGVALAGSKVSFGSFGLKSLGCTRITSRQLESSRKVIMRKIKKIYGSRLWIRIFPDIPVSKKPAEVRMGKGKGSVDHYVARVKKGTIIMEITGVSKERAEEILMAVTYKINLPCTIVGRHESCVEDFYE